MKPATPHDAVAPAEQPQTPVRTLGRGAVAWRLTAAVAALVVLVSSQFLKSNDFFPLGSLSQYAQGSDPNRPVRSTNMRATTTEGTEIGVPLNATGVGVGRAEIEGQLQRIIDDPSLLEGIARAYSGLHPDAPALVEIEMFRTSSELKDGKPTGESTEEVLTTWTVEGTYGADA